MSIRRCAWLLCCGIGASSAEPRPFGGKRDTSLTCSKPHNKSKAQAHYGEECGFRSAAAPGSAQADSFVGVLSDFALPAVTFAYYNVSNDWEPYAEGSEQVDWSNVSSMISLQFRKVIEFKDDNGDGLYNFDDTIVTHRPFDDPKHVHQENETQARWRESSNFNIRMTGNNDEHELFGGIWASSKNIYTKVNVEYPIYGAQAKEYLLALELDIIVTHADVPNTSIPFVPIGEFRGGHSNTTLIMPQANGLPNLYMQWANLVQTPVGSLPCRVSCVETLDPELTTDNAIQSAASMTAGNVTAARFYIVFPSEAYQSGKIHWSFTLGMGDVPVGSHSTFQYGGLLIGLMVAVSIGVLATLALRVKPWFQRKDKHMLSHGPFSESSYPDLYRSQTRPPVSGLLDP